MIWTKYDMYDKTTWPELTQVCLFYQPGARDKYKVGKFNKHLCCAPSFTVPLNGKYARFTGQFYPITHWTPITEPVLDSKD
jgi:hypothetical protein